MSDLFKNVTTFAFAFVAGDNQLDNVEVKAIGEQANLGEFMADLVVCAIDVGHGGDASAREELGTGNGALDGPNQFGSSGPSRGIASVPDELWTWFSLLGTLGGFNRQNDNSLNQNI